MKLRRIAIGVGLMLHALGSLRAETGGSDNTLRPLLIKGGAAEIVAGDVGLFRNALEISGWKQTTAREIEVGTLAAAIAFDAEARFARVAVGYVGVIRTKPLQAVNGEATKLNYPRLVGIQTKWPTSYVPLLNNPTLEWVDLRRTSLWKSPTPILPLEEEAFRRGVGRVEAEIREIETYIQRIRKNDGARSRSLVASCGRRVAVLKAFQAGKPYPSFEEGRALQSHSIDKLEAAARAMAEFSGVVELAVGGADSTEVDAERRFVESLLTASERWTPLESWSGRGERPALIAGTGFDLLTGRWVGFVGLPDGGGVSSDGPSYITVRIEEAISAIDFRVAATLQILESSLRPLLPSAEVPRRRPVVKEADLLPKEAKTAEAVRGTPQGIVAGFSNLVRTDVKGLIQIGASDIFGPDLTEYRHYIPILDFGGNVIGTEEYTVLDLIRERSPVQGVSTEILKAGETQVTVFRGFIAGFDSEGERLQIRVPLGEVTSFIDVPFKRTILAIRYDYDPKAVSEARQESRPDLFRAAAEAVKPGAGPRAPEIANRSQDGLRSERNRIVEAEEFRTADGERQKEILRRFFRGQAEFRTRPRGR